MTPYYKANAQLQLNTNCIQPKQALGYARLHAARELALFHAGSPRRDGTPFQRRLAGLLPQTKTGHDRSG